MDAQVSRILNSSSLMQGDNGDNKLGISIWTALAEQLVYQGMNKID